MADSKCDGMTKAHQSDHGKLMTNNWMLDGRQLPILTSVFHAFIAKLMANEWMLDARQLAILSY
jgi:hypothetical protein